MCTFFLSSLFVTHDFYRACTAVFPTSWASSADTLLGVSTSRCCSCGALLQLQLQLTALGVLQLQHADTPEFVSASSG